MSERGSQLRVAQPARRALELSPELREFLHMLEAIEDEPRPEVAREPKRA